MNIPISTSKKIDKTDGTFLFDRIITGTVISRRLGISLGINLIPANMKICSFNCIYCECGNRNLFNNHNTFPQAEQVITELEKTLGEYQKEQKSIDSITFSGNGEPTLHPQFLQIIESVVELRNKYYPKTVVSVLTNSTRINKPEISTALSLVDNPILKIDSAIDSTIKKIDCPLEEFYIDDVISNILKMKSNIIIQTMLLKAKINDQIVDNTTEKEISELIKILKIIRPAKIQLYSISRNTAIQNLEKICEQQLKLIAHRVEKEGIKTLVTA